MTGAPVPNGADTVVPIDVGRATQTHLEGQGARVIFIPFDGGHTIPPLVRNALSELVLAPN